MTGPAADPGDGNLSPSVKELVAGVRERASKAASVSEIRQLADEAAAHARGNLRTLAEIRQLANVAITRAEEIKNLMARLADLAGGDRERGDA